MQKQIENQNKEIEDLRSKFAEAQKKLKKNAAKKLKAVNPQQSDGDASELEDQVPEETEVKEEVIDEDSLYVQDIHNSRDGENDTVVDDIDIVENMLETQDGSKQCS